MPQQASSTSPAPASSDPQNPLEIHEIIALVGQFVELWSPCSSSSSIFGNNTHYEFNPKQLLSHSTVSKTWRAGLLPVLWQIYDGNCMIKIPNHIISRNSHLFRIIIDCRHHGPFDCTALHELSTTFSNVFTHNLIRYAHQPLTISKLHWKGTEYQRTSPAMLDLSESEPELDSKTHSNWGRRRTMQLSDMPTLISHLTLSYWSIPGAAPFVHFLNKFSNLSTLVLDNVVDARSTNTPSYKLEPTTSTTVNSSLGATTLDPNRSQSPSGLSLLPLSSFPIVPPSVHLSTVFILYITSARDLRLSYMPIIESCPNLEELHIFNFRIPLCVQEDKTTATIIPSCPRLQIMELDVNHYKDQSEKTRVSDAVEDGDVAHFIQTILTGGRGGGRDASRALISFRARLTSFGELCGQVLADQIESLEIFELRMQRRYYKPAAARVDSNPCQDPKRLELEREIERQLQLELKREQERYEYQQALIGIQMVLSSQKGLRNIHLGLYEDTEQSSTDDCNDILLFKGQWACLETLEELYLSNLGSQSVQERVIGDIEGTEEDGTLWIWRCSTKLRLEPALEEHIASIVRHMPRLRRMSLNRVVFFKLRGSRV
ncbi:hypothetical protein BX616_004927 [Lobosporangium transversale]|uniref:F-box domain-containing protein n=1 Tax=Lobosporangium transversale TaxID=64571 RepID=A0A1Y2G5A3_9FUNG|nr:hypothetical protein BCR41DRAFT_365257 [Lobosporangium transversale]KAF9915975.1 hypothetical protein BX616_004927 [Lobosporangium transversale]ORY95094.1 hypothetical protein BCR41DRAFT_365257 [Lobosporangium transversale]|eukprot:XP_021875303.1 hypothetical protein BCR41DRAFT_365257 [Lobosporangium transversale]